MISYLLIGSGRLAQHLRHYFNLLHIPYTHWSRKENSLAELNEYLQKSTHVLLLINDGAISEFYDTYLKNTAKIVIHCSGSLVVPNIFGIHPLMTFTNALYNLDVYQSIVFVLEYTNTPFSDLLPHIPNQVFMIPVEDKSFYHALCVISSNFSILLWEKLIQGLSSKWQIPKAAMIPLLKQVTQNLIDLENPLTGPLVRNDHTTISENLNALQNDPFHAIYQAFVSVYNKTRS